MSAELLLACFGGPQLDLSTQLTKNLLVLFLDVNMACTRGSDVAFKIVDESGIESLRVMEVEV